MKLPKKNPPLGRVQKMNEQREPIFGSGAPGALAYGFGWVFSLFIVYWLTH